MQRNGLHLGRLVPGRTQRDGAYQTLTELCGCMHKNGFHLGRVVPASTQRRWAYQTLSQLDSHGTHVDSTICASLLQWCANAKRLSNGKHVHHHIVKHRLDQNTCLGNLLIQLYSNCGAVNDSHVVFANMHRRNVDSWNLMISAYTRHSHKMEALQLLLQMQQEGTFPDLFIIASILSACATQDTLAEGKRMHSCICASGIQLDDVVRTTLINMYGRCGSLDNACQVFLELSARDVVSWTAMVAAYALHGQFKDALEYFDQMQWEGVMPNKVTFVSILDACAKQAALAKGKEIHTYIQCNGLESDKVVGTALLTMYGKCGSLMAAHTVFDRVSEKDLMLWNALIAAYAQNGRGKDALQLYEQMLVQGERPNESTFVSVLSACSHTGLLYEAQHFLLAMKQQHGIMPIVDHYNCMIDLLGRAGQLDQAANVIRKMPLRPNVISWIILLGACRHQGDVMCGERIANHIFSLYPEQSAPYVMLSHIYSESGRGVDAARVIQRMRDTYVRKQPGHSSVEMNGWMHEFLVEE